MTPFVCGRVLSKETRIYADARRRTSGFPANGLFLFFVHEGIVLKVLGVLREQSTLLEELNLVTETLLVCPLLDAGHECWIRDAIERILDPSK